MKAEIQALPLPNPGDWITVDGAVAILGKSKRQVIRYMADQRLASYRIYGSHDRWPERLIWRRDAEEFRDAMRTLGGRTETKRVRRG